MKERKKEGKRCRGKKKQSNYLIMDIYCEMRR